MMKPRPLLVQEIEPASDFDFNPQGIQQCAKSTANITQNAEHATDNYYNLKNKHKKLQSNDGKEIEQHIQHIYSVWNIYTCRI